MTEKNTFSRIVRNLNEPHLIDIYGAGLEIGFILSNLTIWFSVRYREYIPDISSLVGNDLDVAVVISVIILGTIAVWFHRQSFRMAKQVRIWKEDAEYHGRDLNPCVADRW